MQHNIAGMRCDVTRAWRGGGGGVSRLTYARRAILARHLLGCAYPIASKLASSHRQHETTCRSSVPSCLDSLPVCLPALCHPCCREACALFQRPLSRPRARAARSHLGSSWHTTSVPIRAMQTDCAIRCIMFMLLSDCPGTLHMPADL